jgi:transposase
VNEITTLSIDLAKNVFQLYGVDERGGQRLRHRLRRAQLLRFMARIPPCLVAMEACASAHYWGREFGSLGHRVKLIPPQYVKPYVRGSKTDSHDAQGICEAAQRPNMPSVAVKTEEQQVVLSLHRIRQLLEKQRKQLGNHLRGLLGEFGIVIPKGSGSLSKGLVGAIERAPTLLRPALHEAYERLLALQQQCREQTRRIEQLAEGSPLCRRLMKERGVGPIIASAYVAAVGSPTHYRNGRQVSASLGLVPKQYSSGDEALLLGISKRGDTYLRTQLIHGARAVLRHVQGQSDPLSVWLQALIARRGMNKAAVALANKTARRLWAIWRDEGAQFTTVSG